MITRGIREFMSRDCGAAREAKDAYWRERVDRLGPREGLRIADELRRQALERDPEWPRGVDRGEDLLAHERLSALLRRADSARRG